MEHGVGWNRFCGVCNQLVFAKALVFGLVEEAMEVSVGQVVIEASLVLSTGFKIVVTAAETMFLLGSSGGSSWM